jgi:hypothetical protein
LDCLSEGIGLSVGLWEVPTKVKKSVFQLNLTVNADFSRAAPLPLFGNQHSSPSSQITSLDSKSEDNWIETWLGNVSLELPGVIFF